MPGGSRRKDPTKCRSGRHEWIPANLKKDARGFDQCRLCLLESQRELTRRQRALARSLGEAALIERIHLNVSFWPRIEKRADGCWIWHGCKDGAGYGYVTVISRPVSAHRIAYRIAKGDIPKGLEVCHRCDTPLCVNPDHLFLATHEQNMKDCVKKGRWPGFPNHFDEKGNRKNKSTGAS